MQVGPVTGPPWFTSQQSMPVVQHWVSQQNSLGGQRSTVHGGVAHFPPAQ
jgi:hypothetical protein